MAKCKICHRNITYKEAFSLLYRNKNKFIKCKGCENVLCLHHMKMLPVYFVVYGTVSLFALLLTIDFSFILLQMFIFFVIFVIGFFPFFIVLKKIDKNDSL